MRKILIILSITLFVFQNIGAQNRKIDSLKQAVKMAKHDSLKINDFLLIASEFYLKKPDSAIKYSEKALDLSQKINSKAGLADSYGWLGYLYENNGTLNKACEYDSLSLKYYKETKNKEGISVTLGRIGARYKSKGNLKAALNCYYERLRLSEEMHDSIQIAKSFAQFTLFYLEQNEMKEAMSFGTKCFKLREQIKDTFNIAESYLQMSSIYEILGDIDKSLEYSNKSIDLAKKSGNKRSLAFGINNIATIYELQNEIPKALEFQFKSLKLREELDDKQMIATSLNNLGALFQDQGDYQKALEYFTLSLKIREQFGYKRASASSLSNLAGIYFILGDNNKALMFHNNSLALRNEIKDKSGISNNLVNISVIQEADKNYKLAIETNYKALEISESAQEKISLARANQNLGRLYLHQKDFPNSLKYLNNSLNIIYQMRINKFLRETLLSLSTLYVKRNELDSAESHQLKIIDINDKLITLNFSILSEKEKELFLETSNKYFNHFNSFAYIRKNTNSKITEMSYDQAIKNKGLLLKSSTAMRVAIYKSLDSTLIFKYNNWIAAKKKIALMYSKGMDAKNLEEKVNELEKELVKSSQIFDKLNKTDNLKWKDIQNGLKKGEAAIEFINFNHEGINDSVSKMIYCALLVTKDCKSPEMIRLFEEKELELLLERVEGNSYNYINRIYGGSKNSNDNLYNLIWKPMEPYLKGVKNVYYSPSGLLHKISFAAIRKSNNTFLCDAYQLRQQSSTGKVAFPDNINYSVDDEFMVEGGVKYNSNQTHKEIWKYLPGTLSETQNIQKLLTENKNKVNYFVSENASEENFKNNIANANILHIATHGFFFPDPEIEREKIRKANAEKKDTVATINETNNKKEEELVFRGTTNYANWSFVNNKNPLMRSGLVLANANDVWERDPMTEGEDGILTAQEVSNLDMRKTKLVVLSACETGLGDIKGSEGVYGLQRAFKMAGVKYIIMSLWQVPDKETSEFMTTFYNKLLKEKDIKKAFNQTQKEMRKKYDPYFWAAFVLVE